MLELELEKDESVNDTEIQDEDINAESVIDENEHFNNYFVWGRGTGNIEDQRDLTEYVDSHGGKIDVIKVNGQARPIVNKEVDIDVPTKTSEIDNDSNYVSDSNYVHTDNNFTTQEKQKLSNLENYDDSEIRDEIENINNLIPEEASPTNQLADKEYVDSHTPTLESFTLEIDWSNSSKALATINGKLEEI